MPVEEFRLPTDGFKAHPGGQDQGNRTGLQDWALDLDKGKWIGKQSQIQSQGQGQG